MSFISIFWKKNLTTPKSAIMDFSTCLKPHLSQILACNFSKIWKNPFFLIFALESISTVLLENLKFRFSKLCAFFKNGCQKGIFSQFFGQKMLSTVFKQEKLGFRPILDVTFTFWSKTTKNTSSKTKI